MSTAVAETSSHVSSQPSRQRSGQGNQTSSGDGFSGLVDSNLNAADTRDASQQPDRLRASPSSETQASQRTGIRRTSQDRSEPARQSSDETTTNTRRAPETDDAAQDAEVTLGAQVDVAASTVVASVDSDQDDTTADGDTDDTQATSDATATVPTTGIVAATVTVQIELAADAPAQVIDASDALTISNPPATIAAPAGTAANALARVALDTADAPTTATTTTGTATQTPTDADAEVTATSTQDTDPAQANAAADADQTATETTVAVETAEPEAQLTAKAHAELTATTKADPDKTGDKPDVQQIIASTDSKAKPAPARDDAKAAPDQPASSKTETRDDHRTEAAARNDDQPARTAETESRPAHRASHETTTAVSAHAHTAAADQPQSTGFGLPPTAAVQAQTATVQTAQLTAIPVAANVPVPVGGLAVEIAANAQIGRSRFEIRLDPPELGRIDVRLDVDQKGQVTSHLIVEKSSTLDLLRRDAQQLERALQDAGLKTSDNGLQFSLRDQQQNSRNDDNGSGRNAQRLIVTDEETVVAETAGRSYGRMLGQRVGIDIRV